MDKALSRAGRAHKQTIASCICSLLHALLMHSEHECCCMIVLDAPAAVMTVLSINVLDVIDR